MQTNQVASCCYIWQAEDIWDLSQHNVNGRFIMARNASWKSHAMETEFFSGEHQMTINSWNDIRMKFRHMKQHEPCSWRAALVPRTRWTAERDWRIHLWTPPTSCDLGWAERENCSLNYNIATAKIANCSFRFLFRQSSTLGHSCVLNLP